MDKELYRAPVSEEVKIDGHLYGLKFSQLGAQRHNDAVIYYRGNSEDPDEARGNAFNLWDEE